MIYFIIWYLVITILGLMTFPLIFRALPALRDRGYGFSRTLGLLLWGYTFWLLASLGIVGNNLNGILFSITILAIVIVWIVLKKGWYEIKSWFRLNLPLVIGIEILFLLAFAALAVLRAANPEAVGTEKPMELMFIQAILKSPKFPPHDAWLSGYAISYYYFGYIIIAMLAKITGTAGGVAFNLGISLIFALSATGSYSLIYNLLTTRKPSRGVESTNNKSRFSLLALFGPLFLLIVSNFEGFLHMLHNRGIFWKYNADGDMTSPFWKWLDIKDLSVPPVEPLTWMPSRFWWWWRASRVVQDYDLGGNLREIIDEFPFFSYLLADLHPHVLVMPFALLAIALALNILLGGSRGKVKWLHWQTDSRLILQVAFLAVAVGSALIVLYTLSSSSIFIGAGIFVFGSGLIMLFHYRREILERGVDAWLQHGHLQVNIGKSLYINTPTLFLSAFLLGAIAFLNTWDSLLFVVLIAGAYAFGRIINERITFIESTKEFLWLALISGLLGILLYFPFYLGFSSQAGGIIPNLIYVTRGAHLWVMFGPLLVPIVCYLLFQLKSFKATGRLKRNIKLSLTLVLSLTLLVWIFSVALGIAATFIPQIGELYLSTMAASSRADLFPEFVTRRLIYPGGWLTLAGILICALALLLQISKPDKGILVPTISEPRSPVNETINADGFTTLLVFFAALLVLGPEFVYLRDQFGWRINTIFKFYYQAWLLWSIAAAYGSSRLITKLRFPWSFIFNIVLLVTITASLVYPLFGLWSKTNGFQPTQWTLDSSAYLADQSPDEQAAIRWLENQPAGVIAEAVSPTGGSYTGYSRISTHTGFPTVLGWIGHENQWRGGSEEIGTRQADMQRLYCSIDWEETKQILDQYDIRYVVIGNLERSTYTPASPECPSGVNDAKYNRYLQPVFQQGAITIFRYNPG